MDRNIGPSRKILFAALLISVLSISSAAVMIRLADVPALAVASARMNLAALVLWLFSPKTKAWKISEVNWKAASWAGFFLALHFAFWITSLDTTSVASSLVLVTMNPVIVAVGATFFMKDPPAKPLLVGTFLSIIGCIILVVGEGFSVSGSLKGNFLALGGAVAMSMYIMIGRYSSGAFKKNVNVMAYLTWVSTIAGLLLLIATLFAGVPLTGYSMQSVVYLILIALVPQSIGHTLINWALKYLHASYLAAAILLEPLAGTFLAFVVIGETFSIYSFIGGLLILAGVAIAFRKTAC
jgi:drug/metabolite transporter (DMT)-like permease